MSQERLLLRDAELIGRGHVDLRLAGGVVTQVGPQLASRGEPELGVAGAAVLPGLHDHHCHLLAMAAAGVSTACGPPDVHDASELAQALAGAPTRAGWVRGVGYHESVAGPMDRAAVDRLRSDVPVRVQHRSGALWSLNGAGVRALGLDAADADELPGGIERDAAGRATGRLWRLDDWLGRRLGPPPPPDLGAVSCELAAVGVTGVTDATPNLTPATVARLRGCPSLRQRLTLLGDPAGTQPFKIVVPDHDLPPFPDLLAQVRRVRPRPVALHCVTRVALALILAVLDEVGPVPGDRLEHAAVAPPDLVALIAEAGLVVVTQPSLPARRGDDYLDGAETGDAEHLWPYRSLLDAGVAVACSSDAPYGSVDPWLAIRAATRRRTPSGRLIAGHERVPARTALLGYLSRGDDPGGPPRRIVAGAPADLVVMDAPLAAVLADPSRDRVRCTIVGGAAVPAAGCET